MFVCGTVEKESNLSPVFQSKLRTMLWYNAWPTWYTKHTPIPAGYVRYISCGKTVQKTMFKNEETNLVYANVFGTHNAKVKGSVIYFNYVYLYVALQYPWPQIVLKFQEHFSPKSKVDS